MGPLLSHPPAQHLLTQPQLPSHRRDRRDRPASINHQPGSLPPILRSEYTSCRAHKEHLPAESQDPATSGVHQQRLTPRVPVCGEECTTYLSA